MSCSTYMLIKLLHKPMDGWSNVMELDWLSYKTESSSLMTTQRTSNEFIASSWISDTLTLKFHQSTNVNSIKQTLMNLVYKKNYSSQPAKNLPSSLSNVVRLLHRISSRLSWGIWWKLKYFPAKSIKNGSLYLWAAQ